MNGERTPRESEENERRSRGTRRLRPRGLPLVGLTALAVVGVLLALTPLTAAASTPVVAYTAPYSTAKLVQVRDPTMQGCGASLHVRSPASFNLTTGKATGWVSAKSGSCATSDSQASYDGTVGLTALKFKAHVSGSFRLAETWSITWNASASMNTAAANAGAQSTVEIYLVAKLYDATSKTLQHAELFVYQKDLQSAISVHGGAVNTPYTVAISGTQLVSGHVYEITAVLGFSAQVAVPQGSPSISSVTAMVNLGSAGHGGFLDSVQIT